MISCINSTYLFNQILFEVPLLSEPDLGFGIGITVIKQMKGIAFGVTIEVWKSLVSIN